MEEMVVKWEEYGKCSLNYNKMINHHNFVNTEMGQQHRMQNPIQVEPYKFWSASTDMILQATVSQEFNKIVIYHELTRITAMLNKIVYY